MKNNLNFTTNKENENIIKDYIKQDTPVIDFIDQYCEVTKSGYILGNDLLSYYKLYCNEENIKCKKTGTQLRNEISSKFKDIKESKNLINPKTKKPTARGLTGLRIKQDILAEYQDTLNI
jgi:hypothetical protein